MDAKRASDLVGCRYRAVQRQRFLDVPPTEAGQARVERMELAISVVEDLLPTSPARGDKIHFTRRAAGRAGDSYLATLEAMAAETTLITGAVLEWGGFEIPVEILVRFEDGYLPVIVSNHRVAKQAAHGKAAALATSRLGLGSVLEVKYKMRHHSLDSYRLALANRALVELGQDTGLGATIGQDRTLAFVEPVAVFNQALSAALEAPIPTGPRRVKECESCRFWFDCSAVLERADDISLLLPGERANRFRDQGITTVQGLIDAHLGEPSVLAEAFRAGTTVVPRGPLSAPRFDVELDIDMEAYLDVGAYLWGAFDGSSYRAFVTWSLEEEATNFASFWAYLLERRSAAVAAGQTFGAFCYSNHGENHWMLSSARRFAGQPGIPSVEEVQAFIGSKWWVDVFQLVKAQLMGPFGLGLKVVAPVAGYEYGGDIDGEKSVNIFLAASAGSEVAREELLAYNEDDCRATAAVREWLRRGGVQ